MNDDSAGNQIQIMNYLKIFFRRKEFLIISTFAGLVMGVCLSIILPPRYISSTILLVEEGKTDNPLFNQLTVSTTVNERMSAIRESMLGWSSLTQLVNRLGMNKDIKTPKELEELIEQIRTNIIIKLRGNNLIDLSYVGNNPETTQAVVQNITDIFINRNVEIQNQETADAIAFIQEQLKVYRGKIKSSEIAGLNDQLRTLLLDSTEEHPKVKQLREQIAAKEAELKKENLQYTESVVPIASTSNNPIIQEIKSALDNIEGSKATVTPTGEKQGKEFYKVMLIDKLDNVMARDADVNSNIYNMLLQRLETAKITQRLQASKEGTKYVILDPPRVPLAPVQPKKIAIILAGLVVGLLAGFTLVIGTEFLDKSFLDVEEAKQFLGMPLLGAISKITTEDSIDQEKERQRWIYSTTVAIGVTMVIITMAVSSLLK